MQKEDFEDHASKLCCWTRLWQRCRRGTTTPRRKTLELFATIWDSVWRWLREWGTCITIMLTKKPSRLLNYDASYLGKLWRLCPRIPEWENKVLCVPSETLHLKWSWIVDYRILLHAICKVKFHPLRNMWEMVHGNSELYSTFQGVGSVHLSAINTNSQIHRNCQGNDRNDQYRDRSDQYRDRNYQYRDRNDLGICLLSSHIRYVLIWRSSGNYLVLDVKYKHSE